MKRISVVTLLVLLTAYATAAWAQDGPPLCRAARTVATHMQERGVRITLGNRVEFFSAGHQKFERLFADVALARRQVDLEYFNFRNDSIAGLLFSLLARKAGEGVQVRAVYDAFGNASNNRPISRAMHDSIAALGIQLRKFDPIRFPWVNHIIPRDHRKIVVIDGHVAYTGGMNVADYYIEGLPGIGPWHDLHMRIEGPAVADLQAVFCGMWRKVEGKGFSVQDSPAGPDSLYGPAGPDSLSTPLAIIDRDPSRQPDAIRDLYVTMLDAARHSVKLINPYFVPTHRVRAALKRAVDRGLDVQILLSAKSDIPMTPEVTHYVGNNLMKRGARVFLYEGGFHHTKMMVIDDSLATVGSANLDARSLRCDYEVNTLILSPQVTQQLVRLFQAQLPSSTEIHPGFWRTRTRWKRFVGWFGNLLTPVL